MARVGRFGILASLVLAVSALGLPAPAQAGPIAQEESAQPGPAPAAGPGVAAAALAITATPSTGLTTGASVAVHGTGFPAGTTGVLQCIAGGTGIDDCDLSTVSVVDTTPEGTFDATIIVRRTIRLATGPVRCWEAPDTCAVAAANVQGQDQFAAQTISFDPGPPAPSPSVSVDPDEDLVERQSVAVTGDGFRPGSMLALRQCASDFPTCYSGVETNVEVDADGSFSTPFEVRNRATAFSGVVNCLTDACVLSVIDFPDADYDVTVPLGFDPNGPQPPVPVLSVTPDTGLIDRQLVTVTGSGYDPNTPVAVSQCVPGESCESSSSGFAVADASGAFTADFQVRRLIATFGETGPEIVDCGLTACELQAISFVSVGIDAVAPLSFDPDVPPLPPPTITAEPTTDLDFRQTITLRGDGFTPGADVYVSQCGFDPAGETGGCFGTSQAVADESGAVTMTLVARRFLGFGPPFEPVDCAAAPGTCELEVFSNDLLEQVSLPLTFDPDAPVPPPPTLTVDPATGLGFRQPVTVHATGLFPGDTVTIIQCAEINNPVGQACSGSQVVTVDPSGNVNTEFTVRRTLSNGFLPPVDCAAAPGLCVVLISTSGGPFESAEAPLTFDPDAPIPPPPDLTATPATGLTDGQTVALAGSGFSPNASLGFTLCAEGTLSLNRCDIGRAIFVTADSEGSFAGEIAVRSTITTSEGEIDCGAAPGACFVGAANINDFVENGRAPISFGPEITVGDVAVEENAATVTVVLSRPGEREVQVHWATADGSAVAPEDYVAGAGDLVFAPGETTKTITVEIVAGVGRATEEELSVQLSDPRVASLDPPDARATVVLPATEDPDPPDPGDHDCRDRWDRHRHHERDHHDRWDRHGRHERDHRDHDHRDHDHDRDHRDRWDRD